MRNSTMSRHLLAITFLSITLAAAGQDVITISGEVVDHRDQAPLPYASVTLLHRSLGTICNAEGKFILHVPVASDADTLKFSMIGYNSFTTLVRKIKTDSPLIIRLKVSSNYLPEVVVEDTLTPETILRRAFKRYKQNYAVAPYTIEGFYREVQQSDDQYVSLVECAVTVLDPGYQKQRKVRLDQLRRTEKFTHPSNAFWDKQNLFLHLFTQDYVVNGPKKVKKHPMTRLPDTYIDGEKVYVVTWLSSLGRIPEILYIRADNYAIIKLVEDFEATRDGAITWPVPYAPLLRAKFILKKLTNTYELHDGRYYLKSIYLTSIVHYHNKLTDELFQKFQIQHQFVATRLNFTPDLTSFEKVKHMQVDQSLESIPFKYDPKFWEHYNMIRETPLEEKIKKDLEKKKSLEEQFRGQ